MDLESLTIFARVAELASFTQAAERLGLPKARVSTAIQALEAQLGTRLLHRTTRSVRMTPDGEVFYARCTGVLADVDELGALFQQPAALSGRLRVDLPTGMAREIVIPQLPEFLAAHPLIEIELSTTDRRVDLVGEGFDCVVRVGTLVDSELIARPLGHFEMSNCASPAYLAAHGTPRTLDDLDRHQLIHYAATRGAGADGWEYFDGTRWCIKPMRGSVTVNDAQAYQAACLAGLGLIQMPTSAHAPLLARGELIAVLPQFAARPMPVSLLYAHRGGLSKRLQAWMDWLGKVLAPHLGAAPA
ncbi:MAG TPA: LysR family transcriptional regulator [Burkholderiaceae bacterium]|jgi:DNA-binding transcriptional LysR family regulator